MPPTDDLLNKGFIVNHPCETRPEKDGRTVLDAGYGQGNHGFSLDVGRLGVRLDAIVRIRIAGHAIELTHSGYPLEHYRNMAAP